MNKIEIEQLGVLPEYQKNGIGSMLLEALETKAKEDGAVEIKVIVDIDNPNAKAVYEKIGLQTKQEVMKKQL